MNHPGTIAHVVDSVGVVRSVSFDTIGVPYMDNYDRVGAHDPTDCPAAWVHERTALELLGFAILEFGNAHVIFAPSSGGNVVST